MRWLLLCVMAASLVACAGTERLAREHVQQAQHYANDSQWVNAVIEYRKADAATPGNVELRSQLTQTEVRAADFYYHRGHEALEKDDYTAAIAAYQQGLVALPKHDKLRAALAEAMARRDAEALYTDATHLLDSGHNADAKRSLQQALRLWPGHAAAAAALAKLNEVAPPKEKPVRAAHAPVTLSFRQTEIRAAFEFISKSFGVNIIFDEALRSMPVTLYAKDVSFQNALDFLCRTTKTFYVPLNDNTLLISPDTKDKRDLYEDQIVKVFTLSSIRAKEMADIIKTVLNVKKISINEQMNNLIIRDNAETLKLIDKLIENSDRKPAEMVLEVEILEVNRSKAERLGLDLGAYEIKAGLPSGMTIPLKGSISRAIENNAVLTIPSAVLRFYKQDVDAKTLANPKIRVLSGKAAKIHIGDRIPLRSATINDPTGQVRTTFDYKDIGIRLNAEPTINLDNSAVVKLGLEISSLGENLGTAAEPAFRIGTRNAESVMLLRDGETAVLGGLIRDEDRRARVSVPLLGDIPILGRLFASNDDGGGRTDILLTITPRIVRGWDLPPVESQQFYSGAGEMFGTARVFNATLTNLDTLRITDDVAASATPTRVDAPVVVSTLTPTPATVAPSAAQETSNTAPAVLHFATGMQTAHVNQATEVVLLADNLSSVTPEPINFDFKFNAQKLRVISWEAGELAATQVNGELDAAQGVLHVNATLKPGSGLSGSLLRLQVEPLQKGMSNLTVSTTATPVGMTIQTQSGRLLAR